MIYRFIICLLLVSQISAFVKLNQKFSTSVKKNIPLHAEIERPQSAQIPLKVAVAGAGIGGMFLGFTLQRKGFDVTVFEKSAKLVLFYFI